MAAAVVGRPAPSSRIAMLSSVSRWYGAGERTGLETQRKPSARGDRRKVPGKLAPWRLAPLPSPPNVGVDVQR